MNRPKLEVASWIAGIVGTTLAVLLAIPWGCTTRSPAEKAPELAAIPAPASPGSSSPSASEVTPPSGGASSSISAALAAADQIYGSTARNTEFKRLALLATRRQEYPAALTAATKIYGSVEQDQILDQLSCYAAYAGDMSTAREAAAKAYSTATKNKMYARISSLLGAKPGEGSNEAECRAL